MCHWCQTLDRFIQREKHSALLTPLLPFLRSFHTATKPRLAIWYENRLGMMHGLKKGLAPLKILPAGRALLEELDEEIEFLKKGLGEHGVDVEELEERRKLKGKGKGKEKKDGSSVADSVADSVAASGDSESLVGDVDGHSVMGEDNDIGVEGVMAGVRGGSLAESIVNGDIQREWSENRERGEEEQRGRPSPADNDFVYDRPRGKGTGNEILPATTEKDHRNPKTKLPEEPKFSYRKGLLVYVTELVAYEIEMRKLEGRWGEDDIGKNKNVETITTSHGSGERSGGKLTKRKRKPGLIDIIFGKSIMGKPREREPPRGRSRQRSAQRGSSGQRERSRDRGPSRHSVPSIHSGASRHSVSSRHGTHSARGEASEHGGSPRSTVPSRHNEPSRHDVSSTHGRDSTRGERSRHATPSNHGTLSRHGQSSTHSDRPTNAHISRNNVPSSHGASSRHSQPSRHSGQHSRLGPSVHGNDTVLPTDSISQRPSISSHAALSHTEPGPEPEPEPEPEPVPNVPPITNDRSSRSSSSSSPSENEEDEEEDEEPTHPTTHQAPIPPNAASQSPPETETRSTRSSISHLSTYEGTTTNPTATSLTTRSSTQAPSPLIPSIPPPSYVSNRHPTTSHRAGNSRGGNSRASSSRNSATPNAAEVPIPSGAPPTYASDHFRTRYEREYGGNVESQGGESSGRGHRGRGRLSAVSERSRAGSSMRGPPTEDRRR